MQPRQKFVPARGDDLLCEKRAHAGADCFDREWVNAIVHEDKAARAHGVSSSQNGAEIAGIAKGLRDDPDVCAGAVNLLQRRQPVTVDADQGLRIMLARYLAPNIRSGDANVAPSCFLCVVTLCGHW